ncbi:hypothetical protein G3I76_21520 [Streptomyces sp. SID11233]|nr:hypothetical protein [Streptomyces sp. SID11233]
MARAGRLGPERGEPLRGSGIALNQDGSVAGFIHAAGFVHEDQPVRDAVE